MDFVKDAAEGKMSKDAQPGNSFEGAADGAANSEVDKLAGDVGVPQNDDNVINEAVDDKVNQDIPGGNN
ncbi:hypothetical protein F5Y16DRAFT_378126 [Xylariaceae sp. FL0255]|nr:hypothetical protein F5Y16DRAFT_378126 [Xylariaceae sp. FL0255]